MPSQSGSYDSLLSAQLEEVHVLVDVRGDHERVEARDVSPATVDAGFGGVGRAGSVVSRPGAGFGVERVDRTARPADDPVGDGVVVEADPAADERVAAGRLPLLGFGRHGAQV